MADGRHWNGAKCDLCEEPLGDDRATTLIRCPNEPAKWLWLHAGCLYIATGHRELVDE